MAELRIFTAPDSEAAARLHGACFAESPWPAEAFSVLLASQAQGFALWNRAEMIGLILVRPAADEAEILTFAVDPHHRRQGWGEALLIHSMAALEGQSIIRLFLEVADDNDAARHLYSKLGFEVIAERAGYYKDPAGPRTALVMACNLTNAAKK